jgi:hypothetical protein
VRVTCPECGAFGSLITFTSDDDARAFAVVMGDLPQQLGRPLAVYLSLFRPEKRALTWSRARRLLDELQPLIKSGTVQRHKRTWSAPTDAWREAMLQMVDGRDKLTLPLKSHGYLYEIVCGLANKAESIDEAKREEAKHVGARSSVHADPAPIGEIVTRTWIMGENAARKRQDLLPMTPAEEKAFVERQRS